MLLVELLSSALAFSDGELPFSVEDATLVPDVWERWLAARPGPASCPSSGSRPASWEASGSTRVTPTSTSSTSALPRCNGALAEAGVQDERVRFELYEGRHGGASQRYPLSLAWLVRGLSSSL